MGGTGITTSGSGNTILISSTSTKVIWQIVTSATNPLTLSSGNGYIPKGASAVIFKLPASGIVGDSYTVAGYGNLWQITQNAGQTIYFGSQATTAGIGGSITATMIHDTLEIVCVTANTEWQVIYSVGNPTII